MTFREWNKKQSLSLYHSIFNPSCDDKDAETAFEKYPYTWLWICVPIMGIAVVYGTVWEENINRRRRR
jgi:hypothetical protein